MPRNRLVYKKFVFLKNQKHTLCERLIRAGLGRILKVRATRIGRGKLGAIPDVIESSELFNI